MPAPTGTKAKTYFLDPDLIRRVQVAARLTERTQSDIVREALEACLNRLNGQHKSPLKKPRRSPLPTPAGR